MANDLAPVFARLKAILTKHANKAGKVAFHLMPVYAKPELLHGISPELKKRMQGKSCFNFSSADETLLRELEALTKKAMSS
jgi:hypothetical protein